MYKLLLFLLIGTAIYLGVTGISKKRAGRIIAAGIVFFATIAFFWFMGFWAEMLWFEMVGYSDRFWKIVLSEWGLALLCALVGIVLIGLFSLILPKKRTPIRVGAMVVAAIVGFLWGFSKWHIILLFLNRVMTNVTDPILQMNTGFYLFSLPFYDSLYSLLALFSMIALFSAIVAEFFTVSQGEIEFKGYGDTQSTHRSFYIALGTFLLVLAYGKYLDRFHLMYSSRGAVTGAGWTDVNILLPAYWFVIVVTAFAGLLFLVPPLWKKFGAMVSFRNVSDTAQRFFPLVAALVVVGASWFVSLQAIPGLFQWLRVVPNEITFEKPYINHNIEFTRRGFNLHIVEERQFPASEQFTRDMVDRNKTIFENIRLWDWRALDAVYKQFQEIRLYYEFVDVDIDRYTIDDHYWQVMVSARELELSNLPPNSQTFVNTRFKYTHGYGLTLTRVSEFTEEGLPHLLVKDIPPKSEYEALKVDVPQIYYGELTNTHVIVNTEEAEFDYPSGNKNMYTKYDGTGGVLLSNLWRKFIFGWKFDGTKFFVSQYPTKESRVQFNRQIQNRVMRIAPFLRYDDDPYIVLENGKMYWIIDAYTTSTYYPYSEPFMIGKFAGYGTSFRDYSMFQRRNVTLTGINYIRNSVKVVVDAYNGTVDYYIFDPDDPLIQAWGAVFPDLFKTRDDMPDYLERHIRYPADMLLIQGLVYAKYHMTDPSVFYNQEDLWVRATEKYYNKVQPVEPYYVIWEPPDTNSAEFIIMLPFTPKNKQVLIGWIAGMCDPDNYGRFLAYKFPKDKRVLGTQQMEAKIDQDPHLSGQLTLWDQRGSNVIRGNVLVIPIEDTLLYVEPIYLKAQTAAYPELRLVALMHNDNLSYATSFDKALKGLFEDISDEALPAQQVLTDQTVQELIQQANTAFEDYLRYIGNKQFDDASQSLSTLQQTLEQLSEQTKGE